MSRIAFGSSVGNVDQEVVTTGFEQDVKVWLTSLQAGNLSAALVAFAALKTDFQNPSRSRSGHDFGRTSRSTNSKK